MTDVDQERIESGVNRIFEETRGDLVGQVAEIQRDATISQVDKLLLVEQVADSLDELRTVQRVLEAKK
ncbi:MAG: hypothetical protein AAB909_00035 [Patescibacteria group bacterium]